MKGIDPAKLELIKQGKKKKNVTDFGEKKNVKMTKDGGKIIATEKEKKTEEAGVTRKKRNYVMYESKIGTEKDVDLQLLAGQKKAAPKPRVEETVITKKKRKEYLDNYNYLETKNLNKHPGSIVIHERLGGPVGGVVEEYSYEKVVRGGSAGKGAGFGGSTKTTMRTEMSSNKSTSNVRGRPGAEGLKERTETTRVGRRSGNDASIEESTSKTVTRGGETKKTSSRITRSRK